MSKYKIGLFGFGCVGQGLYETLAENAGIDAEIVKIGVKNKNKQRSLAADKFTFDTSTILNDDTINIVVELIDDPEAAFHIVSEALKHKKAVVTANKKMVAENLEALIALQQQYQTPLLYEGAVCGSIPIIRNLEDYYASEQISEIKGIFNGSSNYILTKLFEEGQSYSEALAEAQANGFAETDPTLDVGGFDPKFKLSILIQHAFGHHLHPDDIFNWGIQNISDHDISFAKDHHLKIKLLAKAQFDGEHLSAIVAPHFVDRQNPLYHVENEYNSVLIDGKFSSNQTLTGKGAGSLPTGLAVLSDVTALTQGYSYRYKSNHLNVRSSEVVEVYFSFKNGEHIDWTGFDTIHEKYNGNEYGYIIGKIELSALRHLLENTGRNANIVFASGSQMEIEIPKLTYSYAS